MIKLAYSTVLTQERREVGKERIPVVGMHCVRPELSEADDGRYTQHPDARSASLRRLEPIRLHPFVWIQ